MAKKVILNNQEYELIKNYRDAFNEKELLINLLNILRL